MKKRISVHKAVELIALKRNPHIKQKDLFWRADERLEWICEHGVGHTVFAPMDYFVHGCDGCCKDLVCFSIKFHLPKKKKK